VVWNNFTTLWFLPFFTGVDTLNISDYSTFGEGGRKACHSFNILKMSPI
jgi:hypothetical protein